MSDPVEFLLACIAEDEAVAQAAEPGPWTVESVYVDPIGPGDDQAVVAGDVVIAGTPGSGVDVSDATHIARWDPARVLAECAAKQMLVAMYQAHIRAGGGRRAVPLYRVVTALVQPYADRPGFDPAWRPA